VSELLAQAEHDPAAAVVAVALDGRGGELAARLLAATAAEPQAAVIQEALCSNGAVLDVSSVDTAVAFANEWAAEHLLLATRVPEELLPRIRNAGTVFLGTSTSVAFGDYMTGANHVLPTGGLARSYSGLSTLDFVRWTTWQEVTPAAAGRIADSVATLALSEGLPAHARAARSGEIR
jgi:histidinol dehydrogenase